MKKNGPSFSDLFMSTFVGEYVAIISQLNTFDAEGVALPLEVQAYILDVDERFYFLGDSPLEINSVIDKSEVKYIRIIEDIPYDVQILNEMGNPQNEDDLN